MDLDEMEQTWRAYDRKLDDSLRLNAHLLRTSTLERTRTALGRLRWRLWVELAGAAAALLWTGSFTARHIADPRYSVLGAALGLCALGLVISTVWQMAAIGELDYGGPVLEIQSRLQAVRLRRVRDTQLALVLGPLLWVPVLLVVIKGALRVDAYALFPLAWILANVLLGVAVLAAALWASRRYAGRIEGSPRLRRLMHDLAGHNVNHALGFVAELRESGRENGSA
jgi:hypothetical protein